MLHAKTIKSIESKSGHCTGRLKCGQHTMKVEYVFCAYFSAGLGNLFIKLRISSLCVFIPLYFNFQNLIGE